MPVSEIFNQEINGGHLLPDGFCFLMIFTVLHDFSYDFCRFIFAVKLAVVYVHFIS